MILNRICEGGEKMNAVQVSVFNIAKDRSTMRDNFSSRDESMFETFLDRLTVSEGETFKTGISEEDSLALFESFVAAPQETDETLEVNPLEALAILWSESRNQQGTNDTVIGDEKVITEHEAHHLMEWTKAEEINQQQDISHQNQIGIEMLHSMMSQMDSSVTKNGVENQLNVLVKDIGAVLQLLQDGNRIEEVAGKLLPLLKSWSAMAKQMDQTTFQQLTKEQLSSEALQMMGKLTELYEKRQHFSSQQMYGQDAQVTSKDVARWLVDVLSYQKTEPTEHAIPIMNNQMSTVNMSVLEQHTIHLSNGDRVERVQQELTQQISNIVQKSKFLERGNLLQELSIVIRPDNLGAMRINFSQVNGEIIVKIITTSNFTKDLLEGNMQQLKHAFSPHQVQVVRDDTVIHDEMLASQEEEETNSKTHDEEEQLYEQEKTEQETEDFATLMKQLQEEGAFEHDQN